VAGTSWDASLLLEQLVAQGEIPIRIYSAILGPSADTEQLLRLGPVGTERGARFTRRAIKVSYDGALGSMGAALLEPYHDSHPATSGFLKHGDAEMRALLDDALRAGIQVETHAIGDRANRAILDHYQAALERVPVHQRKIADPRFRIEHAQVLHGSDVPRFARLGVIPSMQPSHAISDLHFAASRLGPERLAGAYAWRSLLDTGALSAGGPDAPVEAGDPRIEFYAAIQRRDLGGYQGPGWHPEQCVSRAEAVRMFTVWAAYAAFQEAWLGTLEIGKACDVSVFDCDWQAASASQILASRCLVTVVGGRVAHRSAW
jgi:hypothetical protein